MIGHPFVSLEADGDTLLAGATDGPRIFDVSTAGDITAAAPFATLPGTGSVFALLATGERWYAASGTAIYDVSDGGDLTGAEPFATGLSEGLIYQAMTQWNCGGDADCDDADACNGLETCVANTCVPAREPLACDDDDVCTADACDPATGCSNAPIAGCCVLDLDCALDEICDEASNQCVPAFSPTTGDVSTGGEGSSSGAGTEDTGDEVPLPTGSSGESGESSGGADTDAAEADDAGEDGGAGGCSVGDRSGGSWLLAVGLFGLMRRRRGCPRLLH